MPKSVTNCGLICNQGKYSFDPVSRLLIWDIGRIDITKLPNLQGTVSINSLIFYFKDNKYFTYTFF